MDKTLLENLVKDGLSSYEIAKKINKGQTTVRYWLKEFNLKTSPKSKNNKDKNLCLNCNKEFYFYKCASFGKFCCGKCQHEFEYINETLPRFYKGEISKRNTLKKIILKEIKDTCFTCGLKDWNNKILVFVLNHIDGNAGNNHPSNLELLCPNCNSQTDTFSGRNMGKGRKARGLKI